MGTAHARPWLDFDIARLRKLCERGMSWAQIGHILRRPASGCYSVAKREGITKVKCRPRQKWQVAA